jgi:serine/threonine protein kinase
VLYEMLTGTRAFPGEDITDTLAAVVRAEPEWSLVPRAVSPMLLVFLRRSLQKDPKQRVGDIRDMRLALEGAFETAASSTSPVPPAVLSRVRRRVVLASAAAAIAGGGIVGAAVWYLTRPTPPPRSSKGTIWLLKPPGRSTTCRPTASGFS